MKHKPFMPNINGLVWFGFYDISTIVGYLIPNPVYSYILGKGMNPIILLLAMGK